MTGPGDTLTQDTAGLELEAESYREEAIELALSYEQMSRNYDAMKECKTAWRSAAAYVGAAGFVVGALAGPPLWRACVWLLGIEQ